ncbi:MAG TPA: FtsX-like permease family protein [Nitriliruptorales bacterium]|nr:FtsX-like permease family protein [Nitriliruptorales bacterium]
MLHVTWQRVRRELGRLVVSSIAVALGVTFLVAALVLNESTRTAIEHSYRQAYADGDVYVRAVDGFRRGPVQPLAPVPGELADAIERIPGVESVEQRYRSPAQILPLGPRRGDVGGEAGVAIAVPEDVADAPIDVRAGRLPARSGEVAVDAALADQLGLTVGDRLSVLLPQGPIEARLVGTVGFGSLDGLAGGARVVLPRDAAVDLLGGEGPHELAVTAAAGVEPVVLRERLVHEVDGTAARTAAQAAASDAATSATSTAVAGYLLGGVAAVGLLVGGFLVANTLRMLVTQRARELALLRAVGASRRQVATSVLLEAGATGFAGALIGTVTGSVAGVGMVAVSDGLLPGLPPTSATLTLLPVTVGVVVGTGTALLSSRGAIRRASALPPVAAMRVVALDEPRPRRLRLAAGAAALLLGAAVAVFGGGAGTFVVAGGTALAIVGIGVLFPAVSGPVVAVLSGPLRHLGPTALLARQQAVAAPRRTGATAAAMAVALALITFLLTFGESLGAASPAVVTGRQHAELVVRSDAPWGLQAYLEEVAADLEQRPEVAVAEAIAYGEFAVSAGRGEPLHDATYYAADPTTLPALFDVQVERGDLAATASGAIAVRGRVAEANGWAVGDPVAIRFPDGTTRHLPIAATFSGSVTTDWILSHAAAHGHLDAAGRETFVRLADGVSVEEARSAIAAVTDGHPALSVLDRAAQEQQMADANRSGIGLVTTLLSLSVVIGGLGVLNTLNLAVTERIRELGLLRAVGGTRRQVRAIVRWEAVLISLIGSACGVLCGVGLAWVTTRAFPDVPMPFDLPAGAIGLAVLATVVLGVFAAALPARRAARLDVLTAIRT